MAAKRRRQAGLRTRSGARGPASSGKGVSEMEEAVSLGLCPPQSPARRGGEEAGPEGLETIPKFGN